MTERRGWLTALFAVAVLFLGIISTGCSEGENTPAVVDPGSRLKVVLGLENESLSRGFDCPQAAKYVVGVRKPDGSFDETAFAEKAEGPVEEYARQDACLIMYKRLSEQTIKESSTGCVRVLAIDNQNEIMGAYAVTDCDFRTLLLDLTKDDAEPFIKAADFTKKATLNPANYPGNTIKMNVGEAIEVKDVAVTMLAAGVPVCAQRIVTDFTLASDSANLEIVGGKTIVGKAAGDANTLTITCKDGATGTVNVVVSGASHYPVTLAVAQDIDQPNFAAGDKITVKYSVDGKSQTAEVTSVAGYEFYTGAVGTTVAIAEIELYTKATDTTRKATAFEPDEVIICADAAQNAVTVTGWEAAPVVKYPVELKVSAEPPSFEAGDTVTIAYCVNGKDMEPAVVASPEGYAFYKGEVGEAVAITAVTWTSNNYSREATEFDPATPELTISADRDNTVAVVKWADLPPTEYDVTLAIEDGIDQPEAGDTVTVTFSAAGADLSVDVTPDDYTFYKGVANTEVKIAAVSWDHEGTKRVAKTYSPETVTISADAAQNMVTITEWEAHPDAKLTLKITAEENPSFSAGDSVIIKYSVNRDTPRQATVKSDSGYTFYTGTVGESVTIESVTWSIGGSGDKIAAEVFDKKVTLSAGDNYTYVLLWDI